LNGYEVVWKSLDKVEKQLGDDYYFLITIDEQEFKETLVDTLLKNYKTTKNLIVVRNSDQKEFEGIKTTHPDELISFLQKEIHKIQFELDQQKSLARQLKKIWT